MLSMLVNTNEDTHGSKRVLTFTVVVIKEAKW